MRPPADFDVLAPPFPRQAEWVNVATLRMDQQRGRPVLVEFWDFCRVNSLRTLPYLKAWHERYADDGLRVVGVHCAGLRALARRGRGARGGRAAGDRVPGADRQPSSRCWDVYGNQGWPARYLWDGAQRLVDFHFGEGGYEETERAIQELLGVEREPLAPVRPEDAPGALLRGADRGPAGRLQRARTRPAACGRCSSGAGTRARQRRASSRVEHPGAYPLIEHERHTAGVLELRGRRRA